MDEIAGFPFYSLEITKEGLVYVAAQKSAIEGAVRKGGDARLTDLFVISHGWNNDKQDARALYEDLFGNIRKVLDRRALPGNDRIFAVAGVFWPSKKFAEEDLIPSGGAADMGDTPPGSQQLPSSLLKNKLQRLKGTFDQPDGQALDQAAALVDRLEDSPDAQKKFVDLIRSVIPQQPADTKEDASDRFLHTPGDQLLKALSAPVVPSALPAAGRGGAASLGMDEQAGTAAGLGDILNGIKAGAWRLLNYATYYQMKERAGVVGGGLNDVLKDVRRLRPDLRLHLIGHSFGARVVTAAADGTAPLRPSSLALLQGAFSHNGFTERFIDQTDGFFRKVISQNKIDGPIIATHTVNDHAVGIAYPLASRISGDNRAALGDENDVYGGIGRNGAVKMKPSECVKSKLLPSDDSYAFVRGKVHNLLADDFVSSHSDVTNAQVANAVLQVAVN
jgi:hypothetical protein